MKKRKTQKAKIREEGFGSEPDPFFLGSKIEKDKKNRFLPLPIRTYYEVYGRAEKTPKKALFSKKKARQDRKSELGVGLCLKKKVCDPYAKKPVF